MLDCRLFKNMYTDAWVSRSAGVVSLDGLSKKTLIKELVMERKEGVKVDEALGVEIEG